MIKLSRFSTNQNIAPLKALAEKAFGSTGDANLDEWFSFDEMKRAIKSGSGVCVVATQNQKIVGLAFAQQESPVNAKEGKEKWVIILTAVDPLCAGSGIGTQLLVELEKQALAKGAQKIFVFTNKDDGQVVNFYHKNGYADAGWVKDYQYGIDNSAVFLLKYL